MSNENTKEVDDVVVDNIVEEGISNEEADAPTNADDAPETTDNKTNQTSVEDEAASPTIPWWKQKRVLVNGLTVLVIVVVAIVLGVTLSSSNNKCFGADDGGREGNLYDAVRYVRYVRGCHIIQRLCVKL